MVLINFGLSFSPRGTLSSARLMRQDFRTVGDGMLETAEDTMFKEMVKAAPGINQPGPKVKKNVVLAPRSGKLKAGIRKKGIKRSGDGTIDRRSNIIVSSTAAHTRYVIRGVHGREGGGAKGQGRFVPAGRFRLRFGYYPGFKPYDFIAVAKINSDKKLIKLLDSKTKILSRQTGRRWGGKF